MIMIEGFIDYHENVIQDVKSAAFTSTSFLILEEEKSNVNIALLTFTHLLFMGEKKQTR